MNQDRKNFPDDPIVAEVRKIRESYAVRFNYDLKAMSEDIAKRREDFIKMGFKYVTLPKKKKKEDIGSN